MVSAIRMTADRRSRCVDARDPRASAPGPGEVWIEHDAIGVNYLDITQRNGSVLDSRYRAGSVSRAPDGLPSSAPM